MDGAHAAGRERMHIVIAGHVDHGKSTVLGRLLADSGSLPEGKLEQVRALCARTAKPFEFAFLLDALKDEQAQGITIDAARVFFKTNKRDYLLMDAPGHIEFLRNMVTGASRAEAALLVIDAKEGIRENSLRHGYLLGMLGIRQIAVLINKMDLAGYAQAVYDGIVAEYGAFLRKIDIVPLCFIPVQGRDGENIARRSAESGIMPWYDGPTVLETIEGFHTEAPAVDKPLRLPVQDVYKFTTQGDDRRIVAGTIESGVLRAGDELVFLPSGKKSRVKSIEAFNRPPQSQTVAQAGAAVGFTLHEQLYVGRGEVATLARQARPKVTTRLRASLFWLGPRPLVREREYLLKLGTARVAMHVEQIHRVINAADLQASEDRDQVDKNEVAECTLALNRAIAFDLAEEIAATSRFVVVDEFEIRGGGIVRAALPDGQKEVRKRILLRNDKWEPSQVALEQRAERYGQRPALVLLTGERGSADRKDLAKALEARLFADGRVVYYLGMGSVVYGLDADIAPQVAPAGEDQGDQGAPEVLEVLETLGAAGMTGPKEHLRRLAEVANLMLDAGMILIATAAELTQADVDLIRAAVDPGGPDGRGSIGGGSSFGPGGPGSPGRPSLIETIWVGDRSGERIGGADVFYDLVLPESASDGVARIKGLLADKGILFRPW